MMVLLVKGRLSPVSESLQYYNNFNGRKFPPAAAPLSPATTSGLSRFLRCEVARGSVNIVGETPLVPPRLHTLVSRLLLGNRPTGTDQRPRCLLHKPARRGSPSPAPGAGEALDYTPPTARHAGRGCGRYRLHPH
ncbi:unnamed protein product [Pleuronectes platessa]|uniref:Uncharacterized protein n=1 Tax=Pleuronectes platessa TaxID=8262 RepID=A0A9N7TJA5_PLEPL|nr:unnamed protein product [Pleuronectes platessa]